MRLIIILIVFCDDGIFSEIASQGSEVSSQSSRTVRQFPALGYFANMSSPSNFVSLHPYFKVHPGEVEKAPRPSQSGVVRDRVKLASHTASAPSPLPVGETAAKRHFGQERCYEERTKVRSRKHGILRRNGRWCEEENPSPQSSSFPEGRGKTVSGGSLNMCICN